MTGNPQEIILARHAPIVGIERIGRRAVKADGAIETFQVGAQQTQRLGLRIGQREMGPAGWIGRRQMGDGGDVVRRLRVTDQCGFDLVVREKLLLHGRAFTESAWVQRESIDRSPPDAKVDGDRITEARLEELDDVVEGREKSRGRGAGARIKNALIVIPRADRRPPSRFPNSTCSRIEVTQIEPRKRGNFMGVSRPIDQHAPSARDRFRPLTRPLSYQLASLHACDLRYSPCVSIYFSTARGVR